MYEIKIENILSALMLTIAFIGVCALAVKAMLYFGVLPVVGAIFVFGLIWRIFYLLIRPL